jgi:hypothetical protein
MSQCESILHCKLFINYFGLPHLDMYYYHTIPPSHIPCPLHRMPKHPPQALHPYPHPRLHPIYTHPHLFPFSASTSTSLGRSREAHPRVTGVRDADWGGPRSEDRRWEMCTTPPSVETSSTARADNRRIRERASRRLRTTIATTRNGYARSLE